MRRTLSLVAALALALIAAPAAVADAAPAAAVAAPAAAEPAPAAPAVAPALCPTTDPLGNPTAAPTFVSSGPCYVERQCDDGSTISCNGSSSCSSGPGDGGGYVTCDGVTTWCPYEPPPACSDGEFCKYDSMCGTCFGAQCRCIDRTCICP